MTRIRKTPLTYENYYKDYFKRRHETRMQLAKDIFGNRCCICGTTQNLEFDHIDPIDKAINISDATNLSMDKFLKELDKCRLVCKDCHVKKTRAERVPICGTASKYAWGCRCDACREAVRRYTRAYRTKKQQS